MIATASDDNQLPNKGETWIRDADGYPFQVLSKPIDNYVVLRKPGRHPSVITLKDFLRRFTRKPTP